jgi:hypothetical protein
MRPGDKVAVTFFYVKDLTLRHFEPIYLSTICMACEIIPGFAAAAQQVVFVIVSIA